MSQRRIQDKTKTNEERRLDEKKEEYEIESDGVKAKVRIGEKEEEFVLLYKIERPKISKGTKSLIENLKNRVISKVNFSREEFVDADQLEKVKQKFRDQAETEIDKQLPELNQKSKEMLLGNLLHEMVGLGDIELLLADPNLEELVVNSSQEPVWVYHRKYGWTKSNITFESEDEIYHYSSEIARRVGKNISSLNPLLDAQLSTGDRTNATLEPISTQGNTITIRKFARDPWTITDFIENGTITKEVAAFLWLCLQYEMSMIVSGGTGSGKTSLLNVLLPFIPPNQRIISIEDTREIQLPEFLHWVPMTTREANQEGEGNVSMLDLLVNSLRMRPDRILVGEIREKRQAEVLFEAMHTGHSVYSTLHADTAEQTVNRLTNKPINVPEQMVQSVDVNVVMFRDRRRNFRRVFEVAEVSQTGYKRGGQGAELGASVIYDWQSDEDEIEKQREPDQIFEKLKMHTGYSREELQENIEDKEKVLQWMMDNEVNDVEPVGKVIAEYYDSPEKVVEMAENDEDPEEIIIKEREDKGEIEQQIEEEIDETSQEVEQEVEQSQEDRSLQQQGEQIEQDSGDQEEFDDVLEGLEEAKQAKKQRDQQMQQQQKDEPEESQDEAGSDLGDVEEQESETPEETENLDKQAEDENEGSKPVTDSQDEEKTGENEGSNEDDSDFGERVNELRDKMDDIQDEDEE